MITETMNKNIKASSEGNPQSIFWYSQTSKPICPANQRRRKKNMPSGKEFALLKFHT